MFFMPFNILGMWFRGLFAVAIIGLGIYVLKLCYDETYVAIPVVNERIEATLGNDGTVILKRPVIDGRDRPAIEAGERTPPEIPRPSPVVVASDHREFRFEPGFNRQTGYLAAGIALLLFAFLGAQLQRLVSSIVSSVKNTTTSGNGQGDSGHTRAEAAHTADARAEASGDEPRDDHSGSIHRIKRPDGTELQVECYGPAGAPPIVMSHGCGFNSSEWFYAKRSLAQRFRVIVYDEAGLGLSTRPGNNDYSMEKMAADLKAVVAFAGDLPVILVGHSIGGMIILNLCKSFPELMGREVAGLVLGHTSYTNPVRTTKYGTLYTAIETPVIIPLLYLTIATWPLVWAMNWLSYFNGSIHRSTHKQSFSGNETRGQLNLCRLEHGLGTPRRPGPVHARNDSLRRHQDARDDQHTHTRRDGRRRHNDASRSEPVYRSADPRRPARDALTGQALRPL